MFRVKLIIMSNFFDKPNYSQRDAFLIAGIILKVVIALLVMARIYVLVETDAGPGLAAGVLTVIFVVSAIIFSFGLFAGSLTEWMVRSRSFLFKKPARPGSSMDKFLKFWGQDTQPDFVMQGNKISNELAALKIPDDFPAGTTMQDTEDWLAHINGRPSKGKKSKYSDAERFRAIRDWRIMQANGTSVTAQEFLEGRFGTGRRGEQAAQHVPHSTFYGWWADFDEELAKFMDGHLQNRRQKSNGPDKAIKQG
jgi:hypothetical protein